MQISGNSLKWYLSRVIYIFSLEERHLRLKDSNSTLGILGITEDTNSSNSRTIVSPLVLCSMEVAAWLIYVTIWP